MTRLSSESARRSCHHRQKNVRVYAFFHPAIRDWATHREYGFATLRQTHSDPILQMPRTRGLKALGASLVLACSLPVAAAAADLSEQAIKLDQTVQALKDEVLEFNSEAASVEVDALLPAYDRLNVYLSVKAGGLLLQDVTVALDDRPAEVYHYDEFDARAILGKNSLQRLMRVSADPGPHKLRISFTGKYADAKPSDPLLADHYETTIDKPAQATDVEFVISRESRFGGRPRLTMKQWRAAQ